MYKKLFIFFFLLQGCVPIPKEYNGCRLSVTPSLEETVNEALSESLAYEEDFPEKEWWRQFQDPQLETLICRGLQNNPQLSEAFGRLRLAIDEAKIRRSALFPTIGFNIEAEAQYLGGNDFFRAYAPGIPTRVTEYLVNFDFSYEIDFWGKWKNRYLSAIGNARAQIAETAQVELLLSTAIASTYYRLQTSMQELQLQDKKQQAIETIAALQNDRFNNALDTQQTLLSAEENVLKNKQNLETLKETIALERHMLLNLTGEGPNCPLDIAAISVQEHFIPIPEYLSCNLLSRRPDLIVAIWHAEAAAYEVGAAKADFFPNVNLAALGGLDSVFFNQLFQRDSITGEFIPALHLPIFTAGRIKANLRAKRNELDIASSIYNQRVLDAAKEVADSVTTLRAARQKRLLQDHILEKSTSRSKISQNRFENALNNKLEVLESNIQTLNEELASVQLHFQERIASIQLIKSLGGGYCAPCVPVQPRGS